MAVRPRNCGAVPVTVTTIPRVSVNTQPPKQNHALQMVPLFPSPLWEGSRVGVVREAPAGAQRTTPYPGPPPQAGREKKASRRGGRRLPCGDDLVGGAAGELGHVVELEGEGAHARGGRAHLDDEVANLGFRHL